MDTSDFFLTGSHALETFNLITFFSFSQSIDVKSFKPAINGSVRSIEED